MKRYSVFLPAYKPVVLLIAAVLMIKAAHAQKAKTPAVINIILTSDVHFGIKRHAFRGDTAVYSNVVNAAMIKQMNTIPGITLPAGEGVNAGHLVKHVDYLAITGDIANRMEPGIQTAEVSWAQFKKDYSLLKLTANNGKPVQMLLVPGNHDASNAIGYPRTLSPATDPSSMIGIYNMMLKPAKPLTRETFSYAKNKVDYSRNIGGVHFMFITLWADSAQRIWMEKDLASVSPKMPVVVFTHDPPTGDEKHFASPIAPGVAAAAPGSKFEFVVDEHYKESSTPQKNQTDIEQRGWVKFLKKHPNIKAYFHGHSNFNEFYTYKGPDNDVSLPIFRVDSPMKGEISSKDETQLSFQLLSFDTKSQTLTVRECLWNTKPADEQQAIVFGKTATVSLKVN